MQHVKRLEIIIDAAHLRHILPELRGHGLTGYSIFSSVTGLGNRGEKRGDELGSGAVNACIVTALDPERVPELSELLRPLLKKYGGICLISDAQWLRH